MLTFQSGSVLCRIGISVLGSLLVSGLAPGLAQVPETAIQPTTRGWQRLQNFFNRENPPPKGGDRGSRPTMNLCLISPQAGRPIWHRTPLLIWQGYPTVGIRTQDDATVLWQATIPESSDPDTDIVIFHTVYSGAPLAFETVYEGLLYTIDPSSPAVRVPFQTMEAAQYAEHAANLAMVQQEVAAADPDEESLALAKANYFVEQNLPADALQALFSVRAPSATFSEKRSELAEMTCRG